MFKEAAKIAGDPYYHKEVHVFEQIEQADGPPATGAFRGTRIELAETATDDIRYSTFAEFPHKDAAPEYGRFAALKKLLGRQAKTGAEVYITRLENRKRRMADILQRFNDYTPPSFS